MLVIGLTGGIGSGKSTVSQLFSEHGIDIIDADVVAHQLTADGSPHLEAIANYFGEQALINNKQLNRSYIREQVFQNPDKKQWLERYLHPLIRSRMIDNIAKAKPPYCIAAIPLLIESTGINYINRILVIDTHKELQIQRACQRDGVSRENVEAIITQQASSEDRFAVADDIIHNNGSINDLKNQVDKLNKKYIELATNTRTS